MKSDAAILAIETSCDETAAAVVRGGVEVLGEALASQVDLPIYPFPPGASGIPSVPPETDSKVASVVQNWSYVFTMVGSEKYSVTGSAIKAGTAKAMNVVMLGALAACPKNPVPRKILEEAIKDRVPAKTIEANLKAFELGFNKVSEDLRR